MLLILAPCWFLYCKNIFPFICLSFYFMYDTSQIHSGWSKWVYEHIREPLIVLCTGPAISSRFHIFFYYQLKKICTKASDSFDLDGLGAWKVWNTVLPSNNEFIYLSERKPVVPGCEDTCRQASVVWSVGAFPQVHVSSAESSLPWTQLLHCPCV